MAILPLAPGVKVTLCDMKPSLKKYQGRKAHATNNLGNPDSNVQQFDLGEGVFLFLSGKQVTLT